MTIGGIPILTGIIGNALVIGYFFCKNQNKSSYNLFILLLALSDFLGCISFLSWWLQILTGKWLFGYIICKVLRPIGYICICISSFLMVGMAYERYRGITQPLNSRRIKKKHVYLYFAFVSVCSTVCGIPYVFLFTFQHGSCEYYQVRDLFSAQAFYAFLVSWEVSKTIPMILMCYFYFRIKSSLRQQKDSIQSSIIVQRNQAVLKTLKLLIVSFVICIGVYSVSEIITQAIFLFAAFHDSWLTVIAAILNCCAFLNNAVNCFIYAGYRKDFRKFLTEPFRRLFCCKPKMSTPSM